MSKSEHQPSPSPGATCRRVRAGLAFTGKQGLDYAVGISAQSVGARAIHLQLATLPPGLRGKAHKHAAHETAIYAVSGTSAVWFGAHLEQHETISAGDFFYIPANMPHLPYNPHASEPAVVLIARTDPNEQESVQMLPELDDIR
jgi:uncharacterized RmlC-like cupin family protein